MLVFLLDDVGFAQLGCSAPTSRRRPSTARRPRPALPGLPHDGDLLAHPRVPAHRAQPPLERRGHHPGDGDRLSGLQRRRCRRRTAFSRRCCSRRYATFAIGKWHLTLAGEYASGASKARWPLSRGFERYYGFIGGKTSQWSPTLIHDNHYLELPFHGDESYHLNADLADRAIEYLVDLRTIAPDKPFFMYYCLGAGHAPHQVERKRIDAYRGQFDQGWDRWREERCSPGSSRWASSRRARGRRRGRRGQGLGFAFRRREAPLCAADGGLRLPHPDRSPHRPGHRASRPPGRARQHHRHGRLRQRRLVRGRRARLVQRVPASQPHRARASTTCGTSIDGAASIRSRTTPGAGPGPATRRCGAGSATCTRAG